VSTSPASPRQVVERLIAAATSGTPGDIADCYADQVVIEMPFAAGLTPARLETTREELRARFASGASARKYTAARDVRLHQTTDPNVLVAEYTLDGTRLDDTGSGDTGLHDGGQFSLTFVMVLTFRDGLIAHARDYSNPVAAARALGRLPQLAASLAASDAAGPGGRDG
jgi:ketosteroid isomerase-like protein